MGSLSNVVDKAEAKKTSVENNQEDMKMSEKSLGKKPIDQMEVEIEPLDVKDYEDLGLIIDLGFGEFGGKSGVDFDSIFPDFYPEEKKKFSFHDELMKEFEYEYLREPTHESYIALEKWMETPTEEELGIKLESSSWTGMSEDNPNWDVELMEWIWSPYSYEEFLRFYRG